MSLILNIVRGFFNLIFKINDVLLIILNVLINKLKYFYIVLKKFDFYF